MTTSPQWKLRRLAARAIKVYQRHAPTNASIAAYETSLMPSAQTFITSYDAATSYQSQWRKEMDEGRGAMVALDTTIAQWKPHLARELPGFDLVTIGDKPTVPEDLVEDAHRVADGLDSIVDADGKTPTWATAGAADVRVKADAAEKETDEAAAADSRLNELQANVRKTGAAFERDLSLFRDTLRAVVGRSAPDFQKLRASRAAASDADDDPGAPSPSGPVSPAPEPPPG